MRAALVSVLGIAAALSVAAAELAIQRLALHDYEDGPLIPPGYEYLPGETVWFSARLTGYAREAVDKDQALDRVRLSWQIRPADPDGVLLTPPLRGLIEEILRPEDKAWNPKFTASFEVPQYAPRGVYRVPVIVRDEIARREVTGQIEFRVRGQEPPPPNAAFGVRNFRFLAREEDRFPLRPPVYPRGAAVFARFDIIGYALEGNNRFAVEYGLEVHSAPNAEGAFRRLLSQPAAAAETGESFYPQRWVPAGFGFQLDPDIPVGTYTVVLSLRDKLSGAMAEFRDTFQVRE